MFTIANLCYIFLLVSVIDIDKPSWTHFELL